MSTEPKFNMSKDDKKKDSTSVTSILDKKKKTKTLNISFMFDYDFDTWTNNAKMQKQFEDTVKN